MKLLLWDIDGTLLLTGFSGSAYMHELGQAMFGDGFDLSDIEFGGQVDRALFKLALQRAKIAFNEQVWSEFRSTFAQGMRQRIQGESDGLRLMPGVRALIDRFAVDRHVEQGLVTGNFRDIARIKLDAAGYDWHTFGPSAFGCEADVRSELIDLAIDRHQARHGKGLSRTDVIVIGDTPRDISAAREAGCTSFGVATGRHDAATLRDAGADIAVDDLSEPTALLAMIDDA